MSAKTRAGDTRGRSARTSGGFNQNQLGDPANIQFWHADDAVPRTGFPGSDNLHSLGTTLKRYAEMLAMKYRGYAGTGGVDWFAGGMTHSGVATVGNVGAGATDLATLTYPAATFANNGDTAIVTMSGDFASNATSKTLAWRFAGSTIHTITSTSFNALEWGAIFRIRRVSNTEVRCTVMMMNSGATVFDPFEYRALTALDFDATSYDAVIQATGGANNDIRLFEYDARFFRVPP